MREAWLPDSPLRAIQSQIPSARVSFDSGEDPVQATAAARNAEVAIVFAYRWESEGMDLPTLNLSANQDKLIEAVAAANPRTVVVLETGGPVTMPWIDKVAGVVEAWYPGIRGAEALAKILTGTGKRAGTEVAEIYASLPDAAGEPPKRLIGWSWIELAPGESKEVSLPVKRNRLSVYDESSNSWQVIAGQYTIFAGSSSRELPLTQRLDLR
jgi:Glycosyl hydrolase family 3 C-terminal domain/Fibronectin type III-like domain